MKSDSDDDRCAARRSRRNPFTWRELQSIISAGDLHKLVRSEEQEQTYLNARRKIQNEWGSIYDYLLCSKFQFLPDEGCGQKRSNPTFEEWQSMMKSGDNDALEQTRVVMTLNDFPYYFEEGVDHFIVWKLGGDITTIDIEDGKMDILRQAGCSNKELIDDSSVFLHWHNPPELKSLPDIDHVHILFHRKAMNRV